MKRLHLHSISDVTTNSSSEMFVCNTKLSVEKVKEVLNALLRAFALSQDLDADRFSDVFGKIQKATEEDRKVAEEYEGYHQEQKKEHANDPAMALIYLSIGAKDGKIPEVGKDIVIWSASDNTIPYELFDVIERSFNAARYHIG